MADRILRLLEDGFAAQRAGDRALAERNYRRVLEFEPANIHALNLLGALCVNAGRPAEAVELMARALAAGSEDAQTHANIALAYKDLGQFARAADHFQRSLRLNPQAPVVLNNLGNVLRLLERPAEAVANYEAALRLQPGYAECWSNLAAALNEANRCEQGLQAVDRALQCDPRLPQAWNNRGDLLLGLGRYPEAIECYRKAIDLDPRYATALINLARAQRDANDPDAALATLRTVLELEPANPQAMHVLGVLREQLGDREAAAECFLAAIRVTPEMTIAHYNLAQIKGRRSTDEELEAMTALWERDDLAPTGRVYLAYGLSRAHELRSNHDQAFAFLAAGNRIKAQASPYDDDEAARYMDAMAVASEAAFVRHGREVGHPDEQAVFVLGMPRSGTSLTEQILASHSQVAGAGELSFAYDTVRRIRDLTGRPFPQGMALLSAAQYADLGRYYMSRHAATDLERRIVVDKTPLNFQYIGLLALALPRARFIHCHRDPIANCYAIHRMPFDQRQTYAHDLAALGKYYTRYWNLMQRWKALFPDRILDVRYEDTVADTERQSRRILEFLELPFEDSVLRFYETQRLVKTPSASQVREPIYSESLAAWKKYEKHLQPLIENLAINTTESISHAAG